MIVQAKRNVFEGQKNEMMKNQKIERDDKLCHRKKLQSSNDGENILERSGAIKRSVLAEVIDMKGEEIAHCNEKQRTLE